MRWRWIGDGQVFKGKTYEKVVRAMAALKLDEPTSTESYRRATARRVSEMYNVIIDADTDRDFLRSLEAAKLVERLS